MSAPKSLWGRWGQLIELKVNDKLVKIGLLGLGYLKEESRYSLELAFSTSSWLKIFLDKKMVRIAAKIEEPTNKRHYEYQKFQQ